MTQSKISVIWGAAIFGACILVLMSSLCVAVDVNMRVGPLAIFLSITHIYGGTKALPEW